MHLPVCGTRDASCEPSHPCASCPPWQLPAVPAGGGGFGAGAVDAFWRRLHGGRPDTVCGGARLTGSSRLWGRQHGLSRDRWRPCNRRGWQRGSGRGRGGTERQGLAGGAQPEAPPGVGGAPAAAGACLSGLAGGSSTGALPRRLLLLLPAQRRQACGWTQRRLPCSLSCTRVVRKKKAACMLHLLSSPGGPALDWPLHGSGLAAPSRRGCRQDGVHPCWRCQPGAGAVRRACSTGSWAAPARRGGAGRHVSALQCTHGCSGGGAPHGAGGRGCRMHWEEGCPATLCPRPGCWALHLLLWQRSRPPKPALWLTCIHVFAMCCHPLIPVPAGLLDAPHRA